MKPKQTRRDITDEVAEGMELLTPWLFNARVRSVFFVGCILALFVVGAFLYPARWLIRDKQRREGR